MKDLPSAPEAELTSIAVKMKAKLMRSVNQFTAILDSCNYSEVNGFYMSERCRCDTRHGTVVNTQIHFYLRLFGTVEDDSHQICLS